MKLAMFVYYFFGKLSQEKLHGKYINESLFDFLYR